MILIVSLCSTNNNDDDADWSSHDSSYAAPQI